MAIGDVYRLVRSVELDGQLHVNVLHFLQTLTVGADPETDLMDDWDDNFVPTCPEKLYQLCQAGYTSLVQVGLTAQKVLPIEGDLFGRGIESIPGAAVDSGLPTFASVKTTISTAQPGRSGRGGFFISGIPEGYTTGNVLAFGGTSAFDNFLGAIELVYSAGGAAYAGFTIGVLSRLLVDFYPATSLSANTVLGTMRSRKAGVGA